MRIGDEPLVGRGDADLGERRARLFARRCTRDPAMRDNRLDHLRIDPQHRIQRHHRILENHRDAVAAKLSQVLFAQRAKIASLEAQVSRDDATRRIDEAHDRVAGHRLAGPRFTDQSQHLAARDGEGDVVDRLDHARLGEEVGLQTVNFEQGCTSKVVVPARFGNRGHHRCSAAGRRQD